MKGIILAGGTGSRLRPVTLCISKQLLPVYNKPLIYFPLATLMSAGVREILIITTPHDQLLFQKLLGDGSQWGLNLSYLVQEIPKGLADAFILGESFLGEDPCILILGDNIFHGPGLGTNLSRVHSSNGAEIFAYQVSNPKEYGVIEIDTQGQPISIEEKPAIPKSNWAVTGLYFFDNSVSARAKSVKPSSRGEIEITSVIESYLQDKTLGVNFLSRGIAWLDTGNVKAIHDASTYVRVLEERTGLQIANLEEIALRNKWISQESALSLTVGRGDPDSKEYMVRIIRELGLNQ
jgi:glucose-1-phosphate thymidylyltransferase